MLRRNILHELHYPLPHIMQLPTVFHGFNGIDESPESSDSSVDLENQQLLPAKGTSSSTTRFTH